MRILPLLLVCSLAPVVLAQSADLSVTVTMPSTAIYDAVAPFSLATATGQLTVTNAGPSTAQNVTIDFDTHLSNVFVPGFTCGTTNGHYRCTAASMAPGSVTVSFSETWGLPRDGTSNGAVETTTVSVSSSSPTDPNAANNSASANTTVVWQSDPELSGVDADSPKAAGSYAIVTANYVNNGPSPASDFKLTLTVPAGTSYDSDSADKWLTCTEPPKGGQGDLVCTAPALGVLKGSVSALVRVDPATPPGTVITFPVTIASTSAIKPAQTLSGSLNVVDPAGLQVVMSAPASAHAGDTFLTSFTVTNQGPGAAFKPQVFYKPATGASYGQLTGPADWACLGYSCNINSFAPGTATFTFSTTIPWNASAGTLTVQAVAQAANNVPALVTIATAPTAVLTWPPSTVKLTMTAAPDAVHTGDQLTYTATIANTGNADAKNVLLYWTLPGTVSATTCGTISDSVCTFMTIGAGTTQTATRTVHVDAATGTLLTAQTMVKAANVAYDAQSASATLTTTVADTPHPDPLPRLAVSLTTDQATLNAGGTITYTIVATNLGGSPASNVAVEFSMPPSLAFLSASPQCTGSSPVTCSAGTLNSGSSATFTVTARAIEAGTITATAAVSTTSQESDGGNHTAAATVVVNAVTTPARRRAARH